MSHTDTLTIAYLNGVDLQIDDMQKSLRSYFNFENDLIRDIDAHFSCYQTAMPLTTAVGPRIRKWSIYIIIRFALFACLALQSLELPALLTKTILQALLDDRWPNIVDYHYNLVVEAVKHYHDPPTHPVKRRLMSVKD